MLSDHNPHLPLFPACKTAPHASPAQDAAGNQDLGFRTWGSAFRSHHNFLYQSSHSATPPQQTPTPLNPDAGARISSQIPQQQTPAPLNPDPGAQVEPSFASQLWRGVRFCLSLLLGITVLSVVFEEKGLGRGMLNNPDHRPEQVSNVRFTDVKGVDEAKVGPRLTA